MQRVAEHRQRLQRRLPRGGRAVLDRDAIAQMSRVQHHAGVHRDLAGDVSDAVADDARHVRGDRRRRRRELDPELEEPGVDLGVVHGGILPRRRKASRSSYSTPTGSGSGSTFRIEPVDAAHPHLRARRDRVAQAPAAPHRALHVDGSVGREPAPRLPHQPDQALLRRDDPVARLHRHRQREPVEQPARDHRAHDQPRGDPDRLAHAPVREERPARERHQPQIGEHPQPSQSEVGDHRPDPRQQQHGAGPRRHGHGRPVDPERHEEQPREAREPEPRLGELERQTGEAEHQQHVDHRRGRDRVRTAHEQPGLDEPDRHPNPVRHVRVGGRNLRVQLPGAIGGLDGMPVHLVQQVDHRGRAELGEPVLHRERPRHRLVLMREVDALAVPSREPPLDRRVEVGGRRRRDATGRSGPAARSANRARRRRATPRPSAASPPRWPAPAPLPPTRGPARAGPRAVAPARRRLGRSCPRCRVAARSPHARRRPHRGAPGGTPSRAGRSPPRP